MKAIFFIFLLSLVCCNSTFDTIKCLAKNEKIINQIVTVIDSFKTKDFGKIFQSLFETFFTVKNEVEKCLKEEEPILKISPKSEPSPDYNQDELGECLKKCEILFDNHECIKECEELYGDGDEFNQWYF